MQKTVFLNIPTPIIIRNFLLIPGSVFEILKKEGCKIVLVVPEPAYESVKRDFVGENVFVESVPISYKQTLSQKIYTFVATYLNFTEGARLFAKLGVRIDVPAAGGRSYLYYVKILIAHTLGKSKWVRGWLMPKLDSVVFRERPYRFLFDKHKPDLVFLPDFHGVQDIPLLRESKRQQVNTVGMVGSWDHFPKRFEPLKLDKILVWSEIFKKEAMELQDYTEEDVVVTGVPQYDIFAKKELLLDRDTFFKKFGLDLKRKLIFFTSSTKYAPDDGDIANTLVNFITDNRLVNSAQLFIRPYPGVDYDHGKFDQFEGNSHVYIDWIETKRLFGHKGHSWYPTLDEVLHFMNCLYHSDVVVNTYSSVSVEASALLKPIININYDGHKERPFTESIKRFKHLSHYRHVLETGGVVQVDNEEEFLSALNSFLENPDVNRKNIESLRDKMCWKIDGKASERIANCILEKIK